MIFKTKPILGAIALILGLYAFSNAQDCPSPQGCVIITREAALKAIADADRVAAQTEEIKVKDQAIADLKELLNKMRIEFASVSGELTATKQNAVSDRAIIELLLKNTKKKCMPLSICF